MTSSAAFLDAPPLIDRPRNIQLNGARVHMIGIGGSGMSGLAGMLLRRGVTISGTDGVASDALAQLAARGVRISTSQTAADMPADVSLIVASAAVSRDHSQMVEARRRGVAIVKYAEMLGTLMSQRHGIAVSGTHGKSTTTSWTAYTLKSAGLDPCFIVGASCDQLGGSSGVGDGPHFVAEACEFDRSFLNLRPRCACILNIDADHLDYFGDLNGVERAFREFAALLPHDGLLVVNGDDERCRRVAREAPCSVTTFGLSADCHWRATDIQISGGRYSYELSHDGASKGRVAVGPPGRHNVGNSLATAALAHHAGVAWSGIVRGLADFRGAKRRMTVMGERRGVLVMDDYGHHPTEIRATLSAIREHYEPGTLWCIFQPHQYSRTRRLHVDFASSLTAADEVIIPDIFSVRDSDEDRRAVSAGGLADAVRDQGGRARYIAKFEEIADFVASRASERDVVVTMGAGDVWKVCHALLDRLAAVLPG